MKKRVLLLAVSCKTGGLCPGGLDLDDPRKWIRIVKDDGRAGAVQGRDIDYADTLDIIEFEGRPMPLGKQRENWVIDNNSCKKTGSKSPAILDRVYRDYSYHGFWGNYKSYLDVDEFDDVTEPSESILKVTDVNIYKNDFNKAKIDFSWNGVHCSGISMTDREFYGSIDDGKVHIDEAYIVISIPKDCDWCHPETGEYRAYKFVSKIYEI